MTAATFWLIVKTLLTVLPAVIQAVRDGRIREGSQDELANVLGTKIAAKVDAAERARAEPDSMRDTEPDPNDRANRK